MQCEHFLKQHVTGGMGVLTLLGWAARLRSSIQRSRSAAEVQPKQWLFSELITWQRVSVSKSNVGDQVNLCASCMQMMQASGV